MRRGGRLLLAADSVTASREDGPLGRALALTRPAAPERALDVAGVAVTRRGLALAGRGPADDQAFVGLTFGLGGVAVVAMDLAPGLATGTAPKVLGQAVKQTGILPHVAEADAAFEFYRGYRHTTFGATDWQQTLLTATGLEPIPGWLIVLYLLVFLSVVTVGEYLVLRRLHLLHWTWVTTAATVAVFCVAASFISTAVRGTRARHAFVAIHDYGPGSEGRHSTVACFVPASPRAVTATVGREALVTATASNRQGVPAFLDPDRGTLAFGGPVWAPVFLAATMPHREPAPLAADLRADGDRIVGDVTDPVPGQRQPMLLCWQGRYYARGAAGQPWTRTADAKLSGLPIPALAAVAGGGNALSPSALIPQPYLDPEHACLITLAPSGPALALDVKQPRVTATHLIRQVVHLSPKGPPP